MRATVTDVLQTTGAAWGTGVAGSLIARPRAEAGLAPLPLPPLQASACPTPSPLHFHFSPLPALSQRRPPLPTEHRSRRARTPPRKRVAPSAYSPAVIPSPFSTVLASQSYIGKGQSPVFPHHSHGGSSPELALHAASCPRDLSTPPLSLARSGEPY